MSSVYSTSSDPSSARQDQVLASSSLKNNTDVLLNKFLQNNDLNLLENYLNLSKTSSQTHKPQTLLHAPLHVSPLTSSKVSNSSFSSLSANETPTDFLNDKKSTLSATAGSRSTVVASTQATFPSSLSSQSIPVDISSSDTSKTTSCTASLSGGSRFTSPYSTPGSSCQTSATSPLNQFKNGLSSLEKSDDDLSSQMLQKLIASESNKSIENLINDYQTNLNNSRNSILSLQKREKELLSLSKNSSNHNSPISKPISSPFLKKSGTSDKFTSKMPFTEDLSVETFVKCNDLLLYYKIFNAICLKESNNPDSEKSISCSGEYMINLFSDIVDFSNKINPISNSDSDDLNNFDDFDYDSLKNDQTHLGFKAKVHNFEAGSKDIDVPNSLALMIIKKYDTLNFKTLNYILYLCHNFKPFNNERSIHEPNPTNNNEQTENENEASLKKLKSCSRCRKNKIKCDSVMKFSYSCSNCFKKNVNFIKSSIKRNFALANEIKDRSSSDLFNFFQASSNKFSSLNDASYFNKNLEKPVAMKRSESVPSISNFETLSPRQEQKDKCGCGSSACDALQNCSSNICDNASVSNEELQENTEYRVSNLKLFLKLFNLQIIYEEDQHKYSLEPLDSQHSLSNPGFPIDQHNNSLLINCKLQLISSNLLLKKKSMKKNNLINSLISDIDYLKNEINLMIERESKLVDLLYLKSAKFSNADCGNQRDSTVDYSNVKRLLGQVEFPNSKKRKF